MQADIQEFFSPNAGCAAEILRQLTAATVSLELAMFDLTNQEIALAIANAARRAVTVMIVLDEENLRASEICIRMFAATTVQMRVRHGPGLMHDKIAIIDAATVITGSYNWTNAAEHLNNENMLVISQSPTLVRDFSTTFAVIWNRAQPSR